MDLATRFSMSTEVEALKIEAAVVRGTRASEDYKLVEVEICRWTLNLKDCMDCSSVVYQ